MFFFCGVFLRWCSVPAAWHVALLLGAYLWFPLVSCYPVLSPMVLCSVVVLLLWCLAVLFAFLVALVIRPHLKIPCKTRKNGFSFLKINENYALRNPRGSSKTTNIFLTYMSPAGLHGVVVEESDGLCWCLFTTVYSDLRTLISILELIVEVVANSVVARG